MNDNTNLALPICRLLCKIVGFVLDLGTLLMAVAALPHKVPRPKTNPPILHNDLQIDSARLLLSK